MDKERITFHIPNIGRNLIEKLLTRRRELHSRKVSRERANAYFSLDRTHELRRGRSREIPLGAKDSITYEHQFTGHITDRGPMAYEYKLFNDEFRDDRNEQEAGLHDLLYGKDWTYQRHMRHSPRRHDGTVPMYGGIEEAFKAGKVVLELGSGEALGLMEFSLEHPDTVFIGIDVGYSKTNKLKLSQPGLQLTRDDWTILETIPDKSVDTILSLQAAFTWGFETNKEAEKIIKAISRVAKEGAILRFDMDFGRGDSTATWEGVLDVFQSHGWELTVVGSSVIAKKLEAPVGSSE
jgi:hypothetical protein